MASKEYLSKISSFTKSMSYKDQFGFETLRLSAPLRGDSVTSVIAGDFIKEFRGFRLNGDTFCGEVIADPVTAVRNRHICNVS